MPELHNIKCTIHTVQGELSEFEDKNPDNTVRQENAANTITRYLNISGTAGQRFWVQVEIQSGFTWEKRFNRLRPDYMIDGIKLKPCGSCRISQSHIQYHGPNFTKKVNGQITGFTSNMFFKELKFVDHEVNDINTLSDQKINELGRIEVILRRAFSNRRHGDIVTRDPMYKSLENVHEKAFKGRSTSHSVHLDGERPAALLRTTNLSFIDTKEDPYVKFVFLYHTHESLQNLGVIPRSGSPVIEIQQTPGQLKQEIERLASQLSHKKATLKRQIGEADVESNDTIKKEKGASSRSSASRKIKAAKVEIVDLTNEN